VPDLRVHHNGVFQMTTTMTMIEDGLVVSDELDLGTSLDKWERATAEDADEYAAFLVYRDMGPFLRSVNGTQAIVGNYRFPNLSIVAARNKWKLRAELWDQEVQRLRQVASERAIIEMAERHAIQMRAASDVLMMPINALMKRHKDNPTELSTFVGVDNEQLAKMATDSAKVLPRLIQTERLINGLTTTTAEINNNVTNKTMVVSARLTDLSDEQLSVLGDVFGTEQASG